MRAVRPGAGRGPSRLGYKLARAWASARVRTLVRVYLPMALVGLAAWGVVSTDRLRLAIEAEAAALVERLAARPEFTVQGLTIQGATPALERELRGIVGKVEGQSSLTLDIAELRDAVEALPAVRRAAAAFDTTGQLVVEVTRRVPAALWRDPEGVLHLVDLEGVAIRRVATRLAYPDYPLLLGRGAPGAVVEALAILDAAPRLRPRLRGLVRVGERRWDAVLGNDLTVMLPERAPERAIAGAMALHGAEDLLDRDLVAVDLRRPARPVLRLAPGAAEDMVLRRAAELLLGEET